MNDLLHIHPDDNCLVALRKLSAGNYRYGDQEIELKEEIPAKHKVNINGLRAGDMVKLYGVNVGKASKTIEAGSWLHTGNLEHVADPTVLNDKSFSWTAPDVSAFKDKTFQGYLREDGRAGTANYWLFVPLVFCENRNLKELEYALSTALGYEPEPKYLNYASEFIELEIDQPISPRPRIFKNIDGIKFLYHDGGCGGTRSDAETLLRVLAGYVHHPNVAGATVLSLGCQHAQIDWFKRIQKELYPESTRPVLYFEQQAAASEDAMIRDVIAQTIGALKQVNRQERVAVPLSKLIVGLECGGSDGFSGISANPTVGHASDLIVALGGATILSEFPELNGVEQNIVDRCVTRELAEKFLNIQDAYASRAKAVGSGFDMNPSPGNIKDGLITDAIKSAGAAKKGGTAPVSDVLDYSEPVHRPGLNLLCTPGNDVESTTGLAASGANLILFTTGLGTPTGNPVAPVIKIASNTQLAEHMADIIDFNTGDVIAGEAEISDKGEQLLKLIIATASGIYEPKAVTLRQNDFIPWKRGVSL